MPIYESLIGVVPGYPLHQDGVGDNRGCKLFKALWNQKYPEYPVVIKNNPHDFGSYPDIQIRVYLWCDFEKDNIHPEGIETAASDLIDEWNSRCKTGKFTEDDWKIIRQFDFCDPLPCQLEY